MNQAEEQQKPYLGLFSLDKVSAGIKAINFIATVTIGTILAFFSWFTPLYEREPPYQLSPFAWPLIFLFAWPTCGAILWLRITGINWFWSLLAGILILALYYVIHSIYAALLMMLS